MKLTLQFFCFGLALLVLTSCSQLRPPNPIDAAIEAQCVQEIREASAQ